jgi:DMSO/TMAO reductase YedYZ molybdopterin-dependent catalytic subunit
MLGLLAVGFVFWRAQEILGALAAPAGSSRRFTGSREKASFSGNLHPLTNWLNDPIPQVDPTCWRLGIHGEVERESTLSYEKVLALGGTV